MKSIGINEETVKERRISLISFAITMVFVAINTSLKVWDLLTESERDPVFKHQLLSNLNMTRDLFTATKVLSTTGTLLLNVQWVLHPAFFVSMCNVLRRLLSRFNKHLEEQINTFPKETLDRINDYRILHLQMCRLVKMADRLFKYYLTSTIANIGVSMTIILYVLAMQRNEVLPPLSQFTFTFWLSAFTIFLVLFIYFSQKVEDEVRQLLKNTLPHNVC